MGRGTARRLVLASISAVVVVHITPGAAIGSFSSLGSGSFGSLDDGAPPLELTGGDDDVSDLLYDGTEDDNSMAEIDVDEGMDSRSRWRRMQLCLNATRSFTEKNSVELASAVGQLVSQAASQNQKMTEEQIENSIVYAMVLTCYQNIAVAMLAIVENGGEVPKDKAEATFGKIGGPSPRPSRTQYTILDKLMREQQLRVLQEGGDAMASAWGTIIPALERPGSQAAYWLLVMGAIFGSGFWAFRRILNGDGRAEGTRRLRERTPKAQQKVAKAEVKLLRKLQ